MQSARVPPHNFDKKVGEYLGCLVQICLVELKSCLF